MKTHMHNALCIILNCKILEKPNTYGNMAE